ncbi:potassium channel family protein [Methylobacterium sp. WSM2598]|uniref:potassium channel family protein n=1 Tax=Methylobacterium sp. WSM2598 TaxID=398261 RepID=UPI000A04A5CC|nr:potassium channel family protein [Methylobacterium sp. WSM2598]
MLIQLAVGTFGSMCNIVCHSIMMTALIKVARNRAHSTYYGAFALSCIMVPSMFVLIIAHVLEILIWAIIYNVFGVIANDSEVVYFAFVNYTTLGYGDVTPLQRWRLLGPIAAMNGILLFGWSTAVIFEILRRALIRMDELAL